MIEQKVEKEVVAFFKAHGNIIDGKYVFYPHWIQIISDDTVVAFSWDNLPPDLKQYLNDERNGTPTLQSVIERFSFAKVPNHKDFFYIQTGDTLYIFLHILDDSKTVRISTSEEFDPDTKNSIYINSVDLFETKDYGVISQFISTIVSNQLK